MGQGRAVAALVVLGVMMGCASPRPTVTAPAPQNTAQQSPPSDPPLPDRKTLARQALQLVKEKRWDEAVPALTEAAKQYPEVAPFLRLRVIEAELARGNAQAAANAANEIISLGDTTATTVARLQLPAIYAQLGDRAATEDALQRAMTIPIDELTELGYVQLANALASAGRVDLATNVRMRLLNSYPQGRYTEQTYGHLRAEIEKLPNAEALALASKLARVDRYDQALEILNRLGSAEEARATRIRALFNSRNYTQLLDETKDVALNDPALLLLRARAAWRDDKPQDMLAMLDRLEKEFPASREALEVKVIRAKYYVTDEIDYQKSLDNLTKAVNAGMAGSDGENVWNIGYTHVLAGNDEEALRAFDRYIAAYPDGDWKTNSLFWSAKILDKLGRAAERDAKARQIVEEYPTSYYAYRAKELWNVAPVARPTAVFPDIDAELAKITEPRFATVRELLEIDLARDATREMKVLAAKYNDNDAVQYMLADVYVRGGEPFKANTLLQRRFRQFIRHGGTNIPPNFWKVLYPLAYWETIRTEAQRNNLDPYLVASIIRQESGFEPSTVSNAGAVGLMQIMPQEASRIAAGAGLPDVTRQQLFDPVTNIAIGAAEYSQKLAAANGNHVLAIAGYNAGPEAVADWVARTPVEDLDRFIESIPFAETRLYVKTVTRNRHEYRRIYETR
jgi:soluble lytic murein transglycosylase